MQLYKYLLIITPIIFILIILVSNSMFTTIEKYDNIPHIESQPLCIDNTNITSNSEIITEYDIDKIYHPLEEPSRRPSRHYLPMHEFKKNIDRPTRGYPDNFTLIGLLVKIKKNDDKYDILKLFGREVFPGSVQWEYYTTIYNEVDPIKIPIETKKNELYNDDIIFIKELDNKYKISLYKYDAPKYYPDIF